MSNNIQFDSIPSALADIADGKFVIVLDNEDRENEGDLTIAAEHATTEKMGFMIRYTGGYICCAMTKERLDQLELPIMLPNSSDEIRACYCITADAKEGTTTGISAGDRAKTANAFADYKITDPNAFIKPGHMVTLMAVEGGVLERVGHTEATVDICKLAKCSPAGILCVLVNDDGSVKRRDECYQFAQEHGIKLITIEQLVEYRKSLE